MTDEELYSRINAALEQVRPNIQMDGGDIELVRYEDGVVYVRFKGACVGCPAAIITLKLGVEETLKEQVSEVRKVVAVEADDAIDSF